MANILTTAGKYAVITAAILGIGANLSSPSGDLIRLLTTFIGVFVLFFLLYAGGLGIWSLIFGRKNETAEGIRQ